MSVHEHKSEAPKKVNCMVITVSDTRNEETDTSGLFMKQLLSDGGHSVVEYEIVKDDATEITAALNKGLSSPDVHAILFNGGTGIAKRDVTIETISPQFEKELSGFGELFRYLSYVEDIGSAAILSRATAGVINNKVIFSTPGSKGAVKLAMKKLILPELAHCIRELRK